MKTKVAAFFYVLSRLIPASPSLMFLALTVTCFAGENFKSASFQDCYARWNGSELTVGNDRFERKWAVQDGLLVPQIFRIKNPGFEWLAHSNISQKDQCNSLGVTTDYGRFGPAEAESLRLKITIAGESAHSLEMKIFPGIVGAVITGKDDNAFSPPPPAVFVTGIEHAENGFHKDKQPPATENLFLAPAHLRLTQVNLFDQTDVHNELVSENEWLLAPNEAPFELSGNLLIVENTISEQGLIFLKLAPLPHARPENNISDFVINPRANKISVRSGSYPIVTLAYQGGRPGYIAALQHFQRKLRTPDFDRDGVFLCNTWGDRSRDTRINEAFILKEIRAGQRLGADVIQIDDGWQKGRSKNTAAGNGVWGGWWAADPQFWTPDLSRFPHGLKPMIETAKSMGLKIGLWFSPDSSNNATNWQRDAACILKLYRELGIEYFKIDGLDTEKPLAARNERRLFDYVLNASSNNVVFDLDVTAGNRPGYFGMPEIGPIFVENRYTDWHNYWPHQTLRNLWRLSQYVDPLRLRIEILNNLRNATNYNQDPLAPAGYRADTLFAMAMLASPLGWFEISNLSSNQVSEMAPLVSLWKRERSSLQGGTIIPIGNTPDGLVWTGFASVAHDHSGGYLLLFRELNDEPSYTFSLKPLFPAASAATVLAGRGDVRQQNNQLIVTIPSKLDYIWLRLSSVKE